MSSPRSGATLVATDLTRSHGATPVLDRVSVTVGPGTRLGVVGPNGVGKTTLLRILAGIDQPDGGKVTLAPPHLTVGYLPQEAEPVAGETLWAFLARRTGVAAADAELEAAAARLASATPGDDDDYSIALDRYLALGGPDLDVRAHVVCADLGLAADRLAVEVGQLSGGQVARGALAAILLTRVDLLLLDEPTNDLDFAGLDRLERFLAERAGGLVVVSHDRAFLANTVERVLELDEHRRTATEFGGGWLGYLEAKAVARRHAEEAHAGYRTEADRLAARAGVQRQWSANGVRKAKKHPPDNDKALRGFRVDRTEKQAAKVRTTERAIERLQVVDKPWEGWDLHMELVPSARSGDVVARLTGAVVERGSFRLGPIDVEVARADRIAVLGPNGSGKSTLLGALLGEVPLVDGRREVGPGVVVGRLDQGRQRLPPARALLDGFTDASGLLPQPARSLLAKFGLTAGDVERPAGTLSPGERTRAGLALIMASGANCLVLDEPTNHLDLTAIEQLEQALDTYDGTLLLVTHDRQLLEEVRITRTIELG